MGLILLVLLAGVLLFLRWVTAYEPQDGAAVPSVGGGVSAPTAGEELTLATWNIGFAGLGAEADFLPDGGKRIRAESESAVRRHLEAITTRLAGFDADILLLQELADACVLTRGVDVLTEVRNSLPGYASVFTPTVHLATLPWLGRLTTGKGTFMRTAFDAGVRRALPVKNEAPFTVIQHYNVLETRLPRSDVRDWVVYNLHLAAFDDGSLRRRQLEALLDLMRAEVAAGHLVVAGGDWNLLLADTAFPSTASPDHRFWVRPLPDDLDLEGWTWAVDPDVPTCRTLERPFERGVNFTCVIDGFLVGPGVEILDVETSDLGFADSDHQPVSVRIRG